MKPGENHYVYSNATSVFSVRWLCPHVQLQTCPSYDNRFRHNSSGQPFRALGLYGRSPCLPTVNHIEASETAVKYRARQQVLLVTPVPLSTNRRRKSAQTGGFSLRDFSASSTPPKHPNSHVIPLPPHTPGPQCPPGPTQQSLPATRFQPIQGNVRRRTGCNGAPSSAAPAPTPRRRWYPAKAARRVRSLPRCQAEMPSRAQRRGVPAVRRVQAGVCLQVRPEDADVQGREVGSLAFLPAVRV